jgi:hypothetical protein
MFGSKILQFETPKSYLNRNVIYLGLSSILIFTLSAILFYAFIYKGIPSDIRGHVSFMKKLIDLGTFPVPPMYYLWVYLFKHLLSIQYLNSAIITLSVLVVLKYWVTCRLITFDIEVIKQNQPISLALSFLLLLVMPIHHQLFTSIFYGLDQAVSFNMYLGKLAPNIWHNSTTIASMPFVVVLFLQGYKYSKVDSTDYKFIAYMAITGTILILIKPSFLFAFIPAFPTFILNRYGLGKKTMMATGLSVFFLFLIIVEYYYIYIIDVYAMVGYEKTSIGIEFFTFWKIFSDNIPLDLFLSLLFPIAVIIIYRKEILNTEILKFAWILLGFAYLVSIIFIETERPAFGNFTWQCVMAQFLLYAVSINTYLQNEYAENPPKNKNRIVLGIFLMHAMTGIVYLYKILALKSYM